MEMYTLDRIVYELEGALKAPPFRALLGLDALQLVEDMKTRLEPAVQFVHDRKTRGEGADAP